MIGQAIVLWLHLLAAIFWVGGQVFLVSVVIPVLKQRLPIAEHAALSAQMGRRFAVLSGVALIVLVITGGYTAVAHGLSVHILTQTTWGHVLLVKIISVGVMLILSGIHGLYYGRVLERLGSAPADLVSDERQHLRRQSRAVSEVNLLLAIAIVGLAAWLAVLP